MHRYKELQIWQKTMDLSQRIYKETTNFPADEKFGLISQMRRSSVSIASNITEGAGRNTDGEFNQFLGIAQGSAFELETQILIAGRLKFIPPEVQNSLVEEINAISNMIFKLKQKLRS